MVGFWVEEEEEEEERKGFLRKIRILVLEGGEFVCLFGFELLLLLLLV